MRVSEDSALGIVTVFACVNTIANTIAQLPIEVYETGERGRKRAVNHPLRWLLRDEANPEMSAFTWKQTMVGHAVLRGNAFSFIERFNTGSVRALWPIRPDRVQIYRKGGELEYWIGSATSETEKALTWAPYGPESILHIRGLSGDGVVGYSPIRAAREALGLALAAERYGATLFSNGSRPGGVLQHPGRLDDEARANLKSSWEAVHRGVDNAHRVAVLEEGMTFAKMSVDPDDAQFLQTRKFQREEIAALFGVPLHMLGDLEKSSYASVEQQSLDYLVTCVGPWTTNIESELQRRLFTSRDYGRYSPAFQVKALMRGDMAARQSYYAAGRQWGWLCVDDIREEEGLEALPGGAGQVYLEPVNMVPAGSQRPPQVAP